MYPSAGARYPLEVYPIVLNCAGIKPGAYHYSVRGHVLEQLMVAPTIARQMAVATGDRRIANAGCVMVLTSVYGRTVEKYGARGFRYILLEAGHLAQNLALVGAALGLGCIPVGGFGDNTIVALLDVDPKAEDPVYLFAVGL